MTRVFRSLFFLLLALVLVTRGSSAQDMPDPRQMSGVPLPVSDVAVGTVTVRVIRGSFANPVASQTVEIAAASAAKTAVTNDVGRAEFTGLTPGTRVRATAMVGAERLESQEFTVPSAGGIRLILVATDPASAPQDGARQPSTPQAAAVPGEVTLGSESRFVFEMGEDGLSVFYILQIVNAAATPVQPQTPVVFTLPDNARGATVLQGSSPQASVAGREMRIAGPFAPGSTLVQLAYTMPIGGDALVVEQKLPLRLGHVAVVAQKVGEMQLASPQIAEQRTMPAQGNLYIAGRGGEVPAGDVLRFSFSGMPHHANWPRNLALGLAVLILAGGAWSATQSLGGRTSTGGKRRDLELQRDRLFDELAALEARRNEQAVDSDEYAARRHELVSALERIYAALDDESPAAPPPAQPAAG